jgi:endoglucanase Acf2
MLEDMPLAQAGLAQLKLAFARFSENKQQYPLVYECEYQHVSFFSTGRETWKGTNIL